ncbi:unnamed protein product, partial [Urochloa humidicola]
VGRTAGRAQDGNGRPHTLPLDPDPDRVRSSLLLSSTSSQSLVSFSVLLLTGGEEIHPSALLFFCCIMSEMKESNAGALDGNPEPMDQTEDNSMPSAQQQEEAIKKKFGGLMPKKPPLISK